MEGAGDVERRQGPRHLRRRSHAKRRWLLTGLALSVTASLVAGAGYANLQHNIRSEDLLQPGQTHVAVVAARPGSSAQPIVTDGPMNILVLGTDTRAGADGAYGSVTDSSGYGNSDVILIVHISADRRSAGVISIPRDTVAPYPGCTDSRSGRVTGPLEGQMINLALQEGGPSCTVKTIEALTGITFQHFLVADFNAVVDLTNTLGGVPVCVSAAVNDPLSGLNIPKGTSSIQGQQALAFLRTRHGFGDGSDLGRIKAQQSFLASMVRKIKGEGTLTNLPKLYAIADTVTKNLTVDKGLASIPALLGLADRLKNIEPQNVAFITVPNEPYTLDPNRVQLQADAADRLFHAVIADTSITSALAAPAPAVRPVPTPTASATSAATAKPSARAAAPALPPGVSGQTGSQATCQGAAAG